MAFGRRGLNQDQPKGSVSADAKTVDSLSPVQASERARLEKGLRAQVKLINSRMPPGCEVAPWALIPASVWTGEIGQFLMNECAFHPCHSLNNMLLATNVYTAQTLNLAMYPSREMPLIREECNRLIGELLIDNRTQNDHVRMVVSLAQYNGSMVLGEAAWKRHNALFGIGLGLGQRE